MPAETLDDAAVAALIASFKAAHIRMYGFASEHDPVEVVELVVTATSPLSKPAVQRLDTGTQAGRQALKNHRQVWFQPDAPIDTAIYARDLLCAGDVLPGPAIVEAPDSTVLIGIGSRAVVDEVGNIIITAA